MKTAAGAAPTKLVYTSVRTPLGDVLLAANDRGLVRIEMRQREDEFVRALERDLGMPARRDDRALGDARRALRDFLNGRLQTLDLPADLSRLRPFQQRVLGALREVPYGRLVSYGELARRAGSPRASRAVGQALGANPLPILYPCHRVVAQDGSIGGFTGGLDLKRTLLAIEGVTLPFGLGALRHPGEPAGKPSPARRAARSARNDRSRAARSASGK